MPAALTTCPPAPITVPLTHTLHRSHILYASHCLLTPFLIHPPHPSDRPPFPTHASFTSSTSSFFPPSPPLLPLPRFPASPPHHRSSPLPRLPPRSVIKIADGRGPRLSGKMAVKLFKEMQRILDDDDVRRRRRVPFLSPLYSSMM